MCAHGQMEERATSIPKAQLPAGIATSHRGTSYLGHSFGYHVSRSLSLLAMSDCFLEGQRSQGH